MNYILDTNIISELISVQPNQKVIGWLKGVDAKQTFLSVITIGEIKKGIEKLPESLRKKNIQDWFENIRLKPLPIANRYIVQEFLKYNFLQHRVDVIL